MTRPTTRIAFVLAALSATLSTLLWPGAAGAQETIDVDVEQDIVYATRGDVELALDAYLPPDGGTDRPAFIWVHGGKWIEGDKTGNEDVEISAILAEQGFAAFSINYRLASPEGGAYPQAVDDVAAAVEFIRENADRFGVDPNRIALAGESSGAHLAALVATRGEGSLTEGSRVAAVVSFSGPMDLAPLLHDDNPNLVRAVSMFLGCAPDDAACEDLAVEASPTTHVDPSDPPFFITNADAEVIPLPQAEAMKSALDDAGVRAELVVPHTTIHGLGYATYVKTYGPSRMTIPQMYLGFLGEELDHEVSVEGAPGAPPAVSQPSPSPKTAPTSPETTAAPVAPEGKTPVDKTRPGEDSNGWLLTLSVIALIVAALTATLLMMRRGRNRPATPPAPEGDDGERARVDAGSRGA